MNYIGIVPQYTINFPFGIIEDTESNMHKVYKEFIEKKYNNVLKDDFYNYVLEFAFENNYIELHHICICKIDETEVSIDTFVFQSKEQIDLLYKAMVDIIDKSAIFVYFTKKEYERFLKFFSKDQQEVLSTHKICIFDSLTKDSEIYTELEVYWKSTLKYTYKNFNVITSWLRKNTTEKYVEYTKEKILLLSKYFFLRLSEKVEGFENK